MQNFSYRNKFLNFSLYKHGLYMHEQIYQLNRSKIMATIALYENRINQMPTLISDIREPLINRVFLILVDREQTFLFEISGKDRFFAPF